MSVEAWHRTYDFALCEALTPTALQDHYLLCNDTALLGVDEHLFCERHFVIWIQDIAETWKALGLVDG